MQKQSDTLAQFILADRLGCQCVEWTTYGVENRAVYSLIESSSAARVLIQS